MLGTSVANSRKEMIDACVTSLQSIVNGGGDAVLKYVKAAKVDPSNFEDVPFPCAFVYYRTSLRALDKSLIGNNSETWRSTLVIEFVVDDDTANTVLGYIDNQLNEDQFFGGYACESSLQSIEDFVVLQDAGMYDGMLLAYELIHRNSRT